MKAKQNDIRLLTSAWKLNPNEIHLEEKIASGAFGEVWRGALHDRWVVAIKMMRPDVGSQKLSNSKKQGSRSKSRNRTASRSRSRSIYSYDEVKFLIRTRHERLVMFLGCGIGENNECFLVSEFMDGGSLDRVLWGSSSLPWMQRVQILLDVVDGLAYLHLMHKSVHRDVKSPNIMLEKKKDNKYRAKLADFGLSKIFTKNKKRAALSEELKDSSSIKAIRAAHWMTRLKGFVGTPRWMAPEMMDAEAEFGPSADIYSFGVVMWEVWTCRKPWSEFSEKQDIFNAVKNERMTLSCKGVSTAEPRGYVPLMQSCWSYEPTKRPLIDVVRKRMQVIRESAAAMITCGDDDDDDGDVGTSVKVGGVDDEIEMAALS